MSDYLASLLLGFSSDIPMASNGPAVFGNWHSMEGVSDAPFRMVAENFREVGRAVRLLYGRKSLTEIFTAHGDPIRSFARMLKALSEEEPLVKDYLTMQNDVRARQPPAGNSGPLRHTMDLLLDLMETDDWDGARSLAERTIEVSEGESRVRVARALACCLARSTEECDKVRAVELYREVVASEPAEPSDWGALATLMTELTGYDEAMTAIRDGIERFPDQSHGFVEIGMRLIQESGNREFRDWLLSQGRGNQGE